MLSPKGNYNNQKWNVSDLFTETNTVCGNNNNDNNDNRNENEDSNKDDVNLNLNLTPQILNMLTDN